MHHQYFFTENTIVKKIFNRPLVLSCAFSLLSTFACGIAAAADDPATAITINKSSFANTAAIIKEARSTFKAGRINEALQLYKYASEVVDAEAEPILRRKIINEMGEVTVALDQELQRQKMVKITQLLAKAGADFKADQLKEAEAACKAVLALDETNKDAKNFLERLIPQRLAVLKEQRQEGLEREQLQAVNALYAKALSHYKELAYDEAERVFNQILAIDLDQRDADNYVTTLIPQARVALAQQLTNKAENDKRLAVIKEENEKQSTASEAERRQTMDKRNKENAQKDRLVAAKLATEALPKIEHEHTEKMATLAATALPRVMVRTAKFSGNSVFDEENLQQLVAADLGKELSLEELQQIADKVKRYYNDGGYFLAQVIIPEQDVNAQNGVANLTVLEGRLGKIMVAGNKRYSEERVRETLANVQVDEPLRRQNVERGFLVLNAASGITTSSMVQAGEITGTTDINVDITEENRVKGSLSVNNYGTDTTGKYRINPELNFMNLTGRGDRLDASWINAIDMGNMYYGQLKYMTPIGADGWQLKSYAGYGNFPVGQEFATLDIKSQVISVGLGASYPWLLSTQKSISSEAWIEAKDFDQSMLSDAVQTIDDRVRKLRLELFNLDAKDASGRTLVSFGVHQGLGEALGGMPNHSLLSSRAFAMADDQFTKFTPSILRAQQLSDQVSIIARLSGQYSVNPLVAGEQWSIGGIDSVHGHQSSVYLGDDGYTANVQLQWTLSAKESTVYQLMAFADNGMIRIKTPMLDQQETQNISGVGLGFYVGVNNMFDLRLDFGVPIGTKTSSDSISSFEVKYKF